MSFRIRLNGEIVEDFDPYLSRYGMTALWLTAQHLGATVTWNEEERVVDISSGSKLSEWLSEQLRSWSINGIASRCEPSLPPPELLDTLPQDTPDQERCAERTTDHADEVKASVADETSVAEDESSERGSKRKPRRTRVNAVVHHRPFFRDDKDQKGKRTVVSSSSRGSLSSSVDHDLLARYRPG